MSYVLTWKNQGIDLLTKQPITVAVGAIDSSSTDLVLTGKGAANYGTHQQNNLLRLLESFADTAEPSNPTIGQLWYDASNNTLKVLIQKSPAHIWKGLGGIQVTDTALPPTPAALGDIWYERTGSASGVLYVFTGLGRYPTTDTTIGGWEQIHPAPVVYGGRNEYDELRRQLNEIAGESISTFGSGAIGRSLQKLTNFGALDLDLHTKYAALASDTKVLLSTAGDIGITEQAPSSTLFLALDSSSPNDSEICGATAGVPTIGTSGTIYVDGVSQPVPNGVLSTQFGGAGAFIMWTLPGTYKQVRFNPETASWESDETTAWVPFTPVAGQYLIGNYEAYLTESDNTVYPGTKVGHMWAHAVPLIGIKDEHLVVEPNSQDWDKLLAAVKYSLNRLEIPPTYLRAVSSMPFVYDGRPADDSLTSLVETDIRYPSAARRTQRKPGIVTMVQNFAETVNALNVGYESRFALRGINSASGTYKNFASGVTTVVHSGPSTTGQVATLSSGAGTFGFKLRFTNMSEMYRFLGSGGAVQFEFTHTGGANPADTNLRNLLTEIGTWRFTADKTRLFGQTLIGSPPQPSLMRMVGTGTLANAGLRNANDGGLVLTTQFANQTASSGASIGATLQRVTVADNELVITFTVNSGGGALAGSTAIGVKVIRDTEVYPPSSTPTYPGPLPFTATDIVDPL